VEKATEYKVEAILDSRIKWRKRWYKVDWRGYMPEERTWEPAENITHAAEAVAAPTISATTFDRHSATSARKGGTVTNDTPGCTAVRRRAHAGATAYQEGMSGGYGPLSGHKYIFFSLLEFSLISDNISQKT
jgi:Chromo (CHRromatin Organisation MOdifier) domain